MTQFNDLRYERLALSGFNIDSDHVSDMEHAWLLSATGETEGQANDLWSLFLSQRGFDGALNDALYAYLGSQGFNLSDHLEDRLYDWWQSTLPLPGPLPPPP